MRLRVALEFGITVLAAISTITILQYNALKPATCEYVLLNNDALTWCIHQKITSLTLLVLIVFTGIIAFIIGVLDTALFGREDTALATALRPSKKPRSLQEEQIQEGNRIAYDPNRRQPRKPRESPFETPDTESNSLPEDEESEESSEHAHNPDQ